MRPTVSCLPRRYVFVPQWIKLVAKAINDNFNKKVLTNASNKINTTTNEPSEIKLRLIVFQTNFVELVMQLYSVV